MKKSRIITSFAKLTEADMETKALHIVSSMTDNAYFLTPTPSLADVSDMIGQYSDSLVLAMGGGHTEVARKNLARENLQEILAQLGAYVTLAGGTDRAILVSSGFTMAKSGEPRPPITAPENIIASPGPNSGEVLLKVDAVKGARSYSHECTAVPVTAESVWTAKVTTSRKHVIRQLNPTERYALRIAAIGPKDQLVYSNTVTYIVQ